MLSISSNCPFNPAKTFVVLSSGKNQYKIEQYINGVFVHSMVTDLYRASEISYVDQSQLLKLHSIVEKVKSNFYGMLGKLKSWFTRPNKKELIESEIGRKIKMVNFKYIGGLSVKEQLQVIKLRKGGATQQAIANKLDTSRGSVIRILKQKQKVVYLAECFNRLVKL